MCFRYSRGILYKGYFVDTNIMIEYQAGKRKDIVNFVHNSGYRFLYTETVRKEFEHTKHFTSFPRHFTFVQSSITDVKKKFALEFFRNEWTKTFENEDKKKKDYIQLSPKKFEDLKNDLLVIMEAGFTQYDFDDIDVRSLLTNNMKLYNKFIRRKETSDVLERSINLVGLEHLVEVELIDEVLEHWESKHK
jgi:hypothetical protein